MERQGWSLRCKRMMGVPFCRHMRTLAFALAIVVAIVAHAGCGGAHAPKAMSTAFPFPDGAESVTAMGSAGAPGGSSAAGPSVSGTTSAAAIAIPALPEQLVIEGSLQLEVSTIEDVVTALRAKVEELGGRVVEESVSGADASWRAMVKLRVPPAQLPAVIAWLGSRGDITDKQLQSTDVSKTLFDQELALKNAQLTAERLEALLRQGGLSMSDVLAIERELTRLRGDIETIKGQAQYLKDRVALSALTVGITRKSGAVHLARAKAYPGARFAALLLLDPGDRPRTRIGGGFVLHTLFREMTLELELYQREAGPDDTAGDEGSMAVLATVGGAMYSDFLGRGEREFGNPFLGLRTGYGYLDAHRFAIQAEAGVELWKSERFVVDASARLTGLIGSESDVALVLGASAAVAF
jgi:Domain of unknown function (DUF4349)